MGKNWGAVPLLGGSQDPIYHNVAWVEAYLCTKSYPDASSRFSTTDTGQKLGGAVPLFWGESWATSNTVAWAEAYLHTKWHLDPSSRLATIDMGQK